jgi:hypothetical protein
MRLASASRPTTTSGSASLSMLWVSVRRSTPRRYAPLAGSAA